MNFSIIQKSQLEKADRIDAEYYQPEYLFISEILSNANLQSEQLVNLIRKPVVTGSTPKNRICKNDGTDIKFVKTDVVRSGEINFDSADLLPIKASSKNSEAYDGDILLTIIGASYEIVGRAARIFKDDPKLNVNQNIAIIRPKDILLSGYLETFLRSKFGRDQLWQQSRQTEQVNLNCREIENILVPILSREFQQIIEELVNSSRKLKLASIEIYQQAENLLLEELGLTNFKINEDLSYTVNFSDTKKVNRVDADYFQPKYEDLINKIGNKKKLSEFATRISPSTKIKVDYEYNYIEISDVNVGNGEVVSNKVNGKELPANAKIKISGGELIISKVRPTRGAIAIIPDGFNQNFITSGAFSVFNVLSPTKEFLQVVLRSFIGKIQTERPTTGTSYPTITDEDVENIWIPDLKIEIQLKISDLVIKSHMASKKSKELLEEAKRKVEEMIETNVNK